jgi:hypothetical protein
MTTIRTGCTDILRVLITVSSFFNSSTELFLLSPHELLSFPRLSVADLFQLAKFLHFLLCLLLLFVSEAPLPLLLFYFDIFSAISVLFSL